MWIGNLETVKSKNFLKMYLKCNQSVYIFLFVCYNKNNVGGGYEKLIKGRFTVE